MAVPLKTLTLYVPTLVRGLRLRPLKSPDGVESTSSSFREVDDMLALSPMLVGGVEDSFAFDASSTVMTLLIETEEEARVSSTRSCG